MLARALNGPARHFATRLTEDGQLDDSACRVEAWSGQIVERPQPVAQGVTRQGRRPSRREDQGVVGLLHRTQERHQSAVLFESGSSAGEVDMRAELPECYERHEQPEPAAMHPSAGERATSRREAGRKLLAPGPRPGEIFHSFPTLSAGNTPFRTATRFSLLKPRSGQLRHKPFRFSSHFGGTDSALRVLGCSAAGTVARFSAPAIFPAALTFPPSVRAAEFFQRL